MWPFKSSGKKTLEQAQTSLQQEQIRLDIESTKAKTRMAEAFGKIGNRQAINEKLYGPRSNGDWTDADLAYARAASHTAYYQSGLGKAIVDRTLELVVGAGLELESNPMWRIIDPAKKMDDKARKEWMQTHEARFRLWALSKQADYLHERNFYELTVAAFFNYLLFGESMALLRYRSTSYTEKNSLSLQLIPSDHIDGSGSPRQNHVIVDGIEYNPFGRMVGTWIRPFSELYNNQANSIRYNVFDPNIRRPGVLFNYNKVFEHLRRGTPLLTFVMPQLTMLADYLRFELQSVLLNSLIAAWVKPPDNAASKAVFGGAARKTATSNPDTTATVDTKLAIEKIGIEKRSVIIDQMPAGHSIESYDTKRPTPQFEKFYTAMKKDITSQCGLSLSTVEYHFTNTYTAARGELLVMWLHIDKERKKFGSNFAGAVHKAWFYEEVKRGKIIVTGWDDEENRDGWTRSEFTGVQKPDIDPLRTAKGHQLNHEMGYTTGRRVAQELNGSDYDENLDINKTEFNALAATRAKYNELGKKTTEGSGLKND